MLFDLFLFGFLFAGFYVGLILFVVLFVVAFWLCTCLFICRLTLCLTCHGCVLVGILSLLFVEFSCAGC